MKTRHVMASTLVLPARWAQVQLSLAAHQAGSAMGLSPPDWYNAGHAGVLRRTHQEVFAAGRWGTFPSWLGLKGAAATLLMTHHSRGLASGGCQDHSQMGCLIMMLQVNLCITLCVCLPQIHSEVGNVLDEELARATAWWQW